MKLRCPACGATLDDNEFLMVERAQVDHTFIVMDQRSDGALVVEMVDSQVQGINEAKGLVCRGCNHVWTTSREIDFYN